MDKLLTIYWALRGIWVEWQDCINRFNSLGAAGYANDARSLWEGLSEEDRQLFESQYDMSEFRKLLGQ